MALHIGIGNFGGAIASNIYRSQDAPRYILGRTSQYICSPPSLPPLLPSHPLLWGADYVRATDGIELMFVGIGFIVLPIVVLSYKRINARRDAIMKEANERGTKFTPEELRRLGDRAPDFRYTL